MDIVPIFRQIRNREKRAFLAGFLQTGRITKAAEIAGIHYTTHYNWLKQSEAYAKAFERPKEIAEISPRMKSIVAHLKAMIIPLHTRARSRTITKAFSDILAMFWLKGVRPEKYRESSPIPMNGPTQFIITFTDGAQQQRLRGEIARERMRQERPAPNGAYMGVKLLKCFRGYPGMTFDCSILSVSASSNPTWKPRHD